MKKVSLRSFQLKPYDYLNKLPIVLTRYKKEIAIVSHLRGFEKLYYKGKRVVPERVI